MNALYYARPTRTNHLRAYFKRQKFLRLKVFFNFWHALQSSSVTTSSRIGDGINLDQKYFPNSLAGQQNVPTTNDWRILKQNSFQKKFIAKTLPFPSLFLIRLLNNNRHLKYKFVCGNRTRGLKYIGTTTVPATIVRI